MDEPDLEYLVPMVRCTQTIFGRTFFADLVACHGSEPDDDAPAVKRIGPFADQGAALAASMRMYWAQFRDW